MKLLLPGHSAASSRKHLPASRPDTMQSDNETANLQTIRLSDLEEGSPEIKDVLHKVCTNEGFFYLEIDNLESQIAKSLDYLLQYAKRLFDTPADEKERNNFAKLGRPRTSGFKAVGTETGPFGTQDGFELYMIPYNEMLVEGYPHKLVCPQVVECEKETLAQHMREYNRVGLLILERLSEALKLPKTSNLTLAHEPQTPSSSSLSFLKYLQYHEGDVDVGHVAHTDGGTLTLLYSLEDGLQIHHPDEGKWLFVEPRQSNLIVNVADCLSLLTGGRLKSCLHRVIPHPKVHGISRHSFAYFMRPNEMAQLTMANGQMVNSVDWHNRKLDVFAASLAAQTEEHDVLYGKI